MEDEAFKSAILDFACESRSLPTERANASAKDDQAVARPQPGKDKDAPTVDADKPQSGYSTSTHAKNPLDMKPLAMYVVTIATHCYRCAPGETGGNQYS